MSNGLVINLVVARRHEDDGYIFVEGAYFTREFETVHIGHHYVRYKHIELFAGNFFQSLRPVAACGDFVAACFKVRPHQRTKGVIVFGNYNSDHSAPPVVRPT